MSIFANLQARGPGSELKFSSDTGVFQAGFNVSGGTKGVQFEGQANYLLFTVKVQATTGSEIFGTSYDTNLAGRFTDATFLVGLGRKFEIAGSGVNVFGGVGYSIQEGPVANLSASGELFGRNYSVSKKFVLTPAEENAGRDALQKPFLYANELIRDSARNAGVPSPSNVFEYGYPETAPPGTPTPSFPFDYPQVPGVPFPDVLGSGFDAVNGIGSSLNLPAFSVPFGGASFASPNFDFLTGIGSISLPPLTFGGRSDSQFFQAPIISNFDFLSGVALGTGSGGFIPAAAFDNRFVPFAAPAASPDFNFLSGIASGTGAGGFNPNAGTIFDNFFAGPNVASAPNFDFLASSVFAGGFDSFAGFVNPIVLDLAGQGLNVTPLGSSNAFFDTAGDGYQHRTAWAGAGNGVLVLDLD